MDAVRRRDPDQPEFLQAVREVMQDADTERKFKDAKLVPVVSTPEQTVAMLKTYRAQWAPMVRKSGYQQ